MTEPWDGDDYQSRFDALAAAGRSVHGEADLVATYEPARVLDLGCGTGRVAIELARRGIHVVGVDRDPSMLATARRRAPHLTWVEQDALTLALGESFDLVVMAGNVPLFTPPGTQAALVIAAARHIGADGALITGFSRGRGYKLADFDADAEAAGLVLAERFAGWDADPFPGDGTYAVSVHRNAPLPQPRPRPSTAPRHC